ncbi:MAG: STAS-like domain-containing protein [Candidatus Omnitrophota bacterium]
MKTIHIFEETGVFAENKDVAKSIRIQGIMPALEKKERVVVDFRRVEAATQSFIHALISEILRKYGVEILDRIEFKGCTIKVKKIIEIVVDYMQESM